jgi:hypothetical protein
LARRLDLVQAPFPRQLELDELSVEPAVTTTNYTPVSDDREALLAEVEALRTEVTQIRLVMMSRIVIEQAKGIIAATMGIAPDDAFEILVQQSQHMNVKVRDIAQQVVDDASRPRAGGSRR